MRGEPWSREKAASWYADQPWLVGSNFSPSTASNQLEMWQPETFDLVTIERELGWAAGIGMNSARVFLHDLVWEADPDGFKDRLDRFLSIRSNCLDNVRQRFSFAPWRDILAVCLRVPPMAVASICSKSSMSER